MREALRGALLSVLFFGLLTFGTPVSAPAQNAPLDVGLEEVLTVVAKYVPLPSWRVTWAPAERPDSPSNQIQAALEAARKAARDAVRKVLRTSADKAGHTPKRVCSWYDENYRSKGASVVRIGIALGALVYMYWDLRDKDGKLSLQEIELKKQLGGVMAIIAAGGVGDAIVRDACNLMGHPI